MVREEDHLARLGAQLRVDQWRPGGYRTILIAEPKCRLIAAAPFRDRVVHHAAHRVIAPVLLADQMPQSYACLEGRGSHRAVLAFRAALHRHPYCARVDVRRYFLEVQWDRLLSLVRRRIRDRRVMALLGRILESGAGLYDDSRVLQTLGLRDTYHPEPRKGLPIGNLTSQLFANVFLSGVDHFAKRVLSVPAYIRYMDDMSCSVIRERAWRTRAVRSSSGC